MLYTHIYVNTMNLKCTSKHIHIYHQTASTAPKELITRSNSSSNIFKQGKNKLETNNLRVRFEATSMPTNQTIDIVLKERLMYNFILKLLKNILLVTLHYLGLGLGFGSPDLYEVTCAADLIRFYIQQ